MNSMENKEFANDTQDTFYNLNDISHVKGDGKPGVHTVKSETVVNFILGGLRGGDFFDNYRLVPQRQDFSTLYFDFDFKPKEHYEAYPEKLKTFYKYDKLEKQITQHIINVIISQINETYENANVDYVLCDKVKGNGIHLYFPYVLANKKLHKMILKGVASKLDCENVFNFIREDWDVVFDKSISNVCLALPYFKKNEDYYKFNVELSTFPLAKCSERNKIELCFTNRRTLTEIPNIRPHIDLDIVESEIKPKMKTGKPTNDYQQTEWIDDEASKDVILAHLQNLNKSRYASSDDWLKVVTVLCNYKLVNEAIEWSRSVPGFEGKKYTGQDTINRILSIAKGTISDRPLTKATIFKLSAEDNKEGYDLIRRKFAKQIKCTDEILQIDVKYDITVNEKKINKKTVKKMLHFLMNGGKTIVFQGAPSVGKTTFIRRLMHSLERRLKRKLNVLAATSRISQAYNLENAVNTISTNPNFKHLKDMKMHNYNKNKKEWNNNQISSLEHLAQYKDPSNHYFGSIDQRMPTYDSVVFDECNTGVRHFYSDTMKDKKASMTNLLTIIKNAEIVIFMDAQVTNICHSFIEENKEAFGKVLKVRNTAKPKEGVKMIIYNINETKRNINTEEEKAIKKEEYIVEFCKMKIKEIIKSKKNCGIMSDSINCINSVFAKLREYYSGTSALDYFEIFTGEQGDKQKLININEWANGKCILISPSVVTAVDISSAHYDDIFAIYTHTGETGYMDSLQLNQQIERFRDVKNGTVHVLDLDYFHDTRYLNYVTIEQHERDMFNGYQNYSRFQQKMLDMNEKEIDELCDSSKFSFKKTHLHKTYQDRIINRCKIEFLAKIAEEEGYEVSKQIFNIGNDSKSLTENVELMKKSKLVTKKDKEIQKKTEDKIIKKSNGQEVTFTPEEEIYISSSSQKLFRNAKQLKLDVLDPICKNDKMIKGFVMRQRYLNKSDEDLKRTVGFENIQSIKDIAVSSCNKTYDRVKALESIENCLEMERYDINKLDTIKDLEEVKKNLKTQLKNFIIIYDDSKHAKRNEKTIMETIKNIECNMDLKLFIVRCCYNKFGQIFEITAKRNRKENTCTYTIELLNGCVAENDNEFKEIQKSQNKIIRRRIEPKYELQYELQRENQ